MGRKWSPEGLSGAARPQEAGVAVQKPHDSGWNRTGTGKVTGDCGQKQVKISHDGWPECTARP